MKEKWIVHNVSNKPISLYDLPSISTIPAGGRVDILLFAKREQIQASNALRTAFRLGILQLTKYDSEGNSVSIDADANNSNLAITSATNLASERKFVIKTPVDTDVGIIADASNAMLRYDCSIYDDLVRFDAPISDPTTYSVGWAVILPSPDHVPGKMVTIVNKNGTDNITVYSSSVNYPDNQLHGINNSIGSYVVFLSVSESWVRLSYT